MECPHCQTKLEQTGPNNQFCPTCKVYNPIAPVRSAELRASAGVEPGSISQEELAHRASGAKTVFGTKDETPSEPMEVGPDPKEDAAPIETEPKVPKTAKKK